MKKITLLFTLLFAINFGFAQNVVTVPVGTSAGYGSFMNVFDNPDDPTPDCAAQGGYCFGIQNWDIPNLAAVVGSSDVTLSPNTNTYTDALALDNADRDYWTNSTDGGVNAGPDGNKVMEANLFIESSTAFNGNDLTFTGQVTSNTLDSRYIASYFIKALDPNNNFADIFNGSKVVELPASGTFSISALASELTAGLIIQYGFSVLGLNANPADDWGNVVVAPVSLSNSDLEQLSFNVYPNPSNDVWNVKTNNTVINTVQVFDVLGKQVMTLTPESTEVKIDASTLNTGLYIAKIATPNGVSNVRLIKN